MREGENPLKLYCLRQAEWRTLSHTCNTGNEYLLSFSLIHSNATLLSIFSCCSLHLRWQIMILWFEKSCSILYLIASLCHTLSNIFISLDNFSFVSYFFLSEIQRIVWERCGFCHRTLNHHKVIYSTVIVYSFLKNQHDFVFHLLKWWLCQKIPSPSLSSKKK